MKKIICVCLFVVGLLVISYPYISDYIASKHQTTVIDEYNKDVNDINDDDKNKLIDDADDYNRIISTGIAGESSANYYDLLNIGGVIGYISIPKIGIYLPIYHGTTDEILEQGVGHISSSSLPVGGASTHAVLAGHNGLSSKKIFDDLDKLVKGDYFIITVLNRTLKYTVDSIKIVTPSDDRDLHVVDGKDYVTLITCTPRSVNSHRLLVRGVRTE